MFFVVRVVKMMSMFECVPDSELYRSDFERRLQIGRLPVEECFHSLLTKKKRHSTIGNSGSVYKCVVDMSRTCTHTLSLVELKIGVKQRPTVID